MNLEILFEDNHLLVINKAGGVLVQKDLHNDPCVEDFARDYLRAKYQKKGNIFLQACHRIDRPVSGIVVLAKTSKALERMNVLFSERQIEKRYWAIVSEKPEPEENILTHWIQKNKDKNRVSVYHYERGDAKKAILMYKVKGNLGEHYLLEIKLITGRHHQIRAQLSYSGFPILGDLKYKAKPPAFGHFIFLHGRSIVFNHPVTKERVEFIAPVPDHTIWQLFAGYENKLMDFKNLEAQLTL